MEPQRGIGGGEESCGFKSANRFLENMQLGKAPFAKQDTGSWIDARYITQSLNKKIQDVAGPIFCKEPVLSNETFTVGTKQELNNARGIIVLRQTFSEEELDHVSEITQFIMLKNGHYTVYENKDDKWQEWDDQKGIKKLELTDPLEAIAHAFGQMMYGDSGAILYQGKPKQ